MPVVIQFDVIIVVVVVVVIIQGLGILCCGHRHLSRCAVTSLIALPPLLPHRHHVATTIAAPTPVSLCLFCASGWLLHHHLSRRASASLVMSAALSLRRHLFCCAAASLVVPHLRRLAVASPTILTCRHHSCRADWVLLATSLFVPQSLTSPPLSVRRRLFGLYTFSTPVKSVSVCSGGLTLSI